MGNQYVEMGLCAPVNVTWEVTYNCNLSCVHCLSDSGPKRKGELNTQECFGVIDDLSAMKVFQFNIGGGEPFMRPDFLDLMDYAHEKGMVTCISTNGTLINSDTAKRLDNPLVYIQVSLDGAAPESNDPIRGKGSFNKVLKALECLRERDIEVSINTVLTKLSIGELDKMVDLAAAYGAKLRVSRFRPSGRGKDSWSDLNVSKKEMLKFSDWLNKHLGVSTGDSFFSVSSEDRRSLGLNMCGACKLTCCISPTGGIYPCAFLQEDDFRAGKLPGDSFAELWKNSPVFNSFRQLEIKSCESCHRFDLCHGGCPAIAYHTQRKLGIPDPGCLENCVTVKSFKAAA
ncbi:Putative mycofactocin radical SAM maturase [Desulfonema limicola]|uniref:Pre-heme d1 synthase n=1 Tax=Desulfonema limicola TaxID=45656 RepID=A0A975B9W7_9BACT|nr:mycofactocin radical SAM maturase [Desulfonema limicola]QTA81411.1 Putative mycofactocin radical SAM maturase [Desulfonema limicola]